MEKQISEEHKLRLRRLKIELLVLVGLAVLSVEIFFYFKGVSFWRSVFDWLLGMSVAFVLISYAISETAKILRKESQAKCDLEKTKSDLESEIRKRTKELEEAKKGLEKKVFERTKELEKTIEDLKEKNQQLELIEKMVVDRELRMVELKENISNLKKIKDKKG